MSKKLERIVCAECGVIIFDDDNYVTTEDGRVLCMSCAVECEHCGEWVSYTEAVTVNEGLYDEMIVCESCIDMFYQCPECGGYFDVYNWSDEDDMCTSCAEANRVIRWYHAHNPNGLKTHGSIEYSFVNGRFGMELEVTGLNNRIARHVLYLVGGYDVLHFEEDCSVDGAEIIFQPRTIESWLAFMPTLQSALEYMQAEGCTVSRSNGLHVHVSRTAFGNTEAEQVRRTVLLMQGFADANYNALAKASGRTDIDDANHWACNNGVESLEEKTRGAQHRSLSRYRAVNVTNRETIEIRLGASTLSASRLEGWLLTIATMVRRTESITTKEAVDINQWFKNASDDVLAFLSDNGINLHAPLTPIPVERYRVIIAELVRAIECAGQYLNSTSSDEERAHILARIAHCNDNELRVLGLK